MKVKKKPLFFKCEIYFNNLRKFIITIQSWNDRIVPIVIVHGFV